MPSPRRGRRWAGGIALALVALAVAAVAAVSWIFTSQLLAPDFSDGPYEIAVERAGGGMAAFARDETTARRGLYGLDFRGGHALAGGVRDAGANEVTRRLAEARGPLRAGTKVAFDAGVWEGDPRSARGIPFRAIRFPSPLGPMPAWEVEGRGATWAIFVHGRNVTRGEGLRILPTLRAAGLPTVLTAYRNDPGAPASPDGELHLGATEWRDVEAAARYAVGRGARSLVVLGSSMGGAIVSAFVHNSPLAGRVRALILDAPVLDWRSVIDLQAGERGLPGFLATTVEWTVSARIGFDWDAFDQVARAREFRMPILLFHGTQDTTVPISSSDAFARALPRRVTYHRIPGAGHVEAWNVDPAVYERRVRAFLDRVGA